MTIIQRIVRWIHLLSLDAILVGWVWQSIFSEISGHQGTYSERLILGGAIGLAYVADRLIDCLTIDTNQPSTERHKLYRKHWKVFLIPWALLFTFMVTHAYQVLDPAVFVSGVGLVVLINLYYLLVRLARSYLFLGAAKEILTATIFTVGVSFFSLHGKGVESMSLITPQIAFGLLCFINLLMISQRDKLYAISQNEKTLPHHTSHIRTITALLFAICTGLGLYFFVTSKLGFAIPYTIALVGTLTFLILSRNHKVGTARYWADVPLILPVVWLVLK